MVRAVNTEMQRTLLPRLDYKEGRAIRTYIWYREGDYVIVLEKRQLRIGTIAFLITAHYVESEGRKRQLFTKYANREP